MPVEFALRPRIRLREDSPRPQRSRARLPRFALPVAAYWLVVGGITYAFVHGHDAHPPLASARSEETALATEPEPRENRPWWRRVPEAPTPEAAPASAAPASAAPAAMPVAPEQAIPNAAPEPAALPESTPAPESAPPAALSAPPEPVEPRAASRAFVPQAPRPTRTPALAAADPPAFSDPPGEAPKPAPPRTEARNDGLPSCEAALESAHQDVDFSQGDGTADLPTSVIAAVLENGAWLSSCGVPPSTSLDVCIAIRGGNVVGASVVSRPTNADLTACVRRRASSLQFPYSSHVDIARTRF